MFKLLSCWLFTFQTRAASHASYHPCPPLQANMCFWLQTTPTPQFQTNSTAVATKSPPFGTLTLQLVCSASWIPIYKRKNWFTMIFRQIKKKNLNQCTLLKGYHRETKAENGNKFPVILHRKSAGNSGALKNKANLYKGKSGYPLSKQRVKIEAIKVHTQQG